MRSSGHQLRPGGFSLSFLKRKDCAMNSAVCATIDHSKDIHLGPHQESQRLTAAKWRGHGGGLYHSASRATTLGGFGADENVLNG